MASHTVALNQQNVSIPLTILTNSTGVPYTGFNASTAGAVVWYQRGAILAAVTDATAHANLASVTTAHSDWGTIHVQGGLYRCDFPDAAFVEGVAYVTVGITATDYSAISKVVAISPLLKFHGKATEVTATTTTFPSGTTPYKGDRIVVADGTGIKQERIVTSVAGEVATHLAWDVSISATTSTLTLVLGSPEDANLDVSSSTLSTLEITDISAQTATITDLLPSALTTAGNIKADIKAVNEISVTGVGTQSDPWNP